MSPVCVCRGSEFHFFCTTFCLPLAIYTFFCTQYAVLAADDIVKIDLGAHIDGFIVLAAHTVIVGQDAATAEAVATGRRAAVINATYTAAEVAAKLIKNGKFYLCSVL